MRREGGASDKDFVKRVITKLMPNSVQLLLNRTGQKGKTAFPKPLEEMIKGRFIVGLLHCGNFVFFKPAIRPN